MARVVLAPGALKRRSVEFAAAAADRVASSLALVVVREIRCLFDEYEAEMPPLAAEGPDRVAFEFRIEGPFGGPILLLVALREAVTLAGLLCMLTAKQLEERLASPRLENSDGESLREIGNLLRGAIEETLRLHSNESLHVSAGAVGLFEPLVRDRAAAWPRCLVAKGRIDIAGHGAGQLVLFVAERVARAADPELDLARMTEKAAPPAHATSAAAVASVAEPQPSGPPAHTVIVYEPDDFYLKLLVTALGPHGQVVAATTLQQLRQLLKVSPRAALVVDVAPDDRRAMDEIAALRKLAAKPPVVATLGRATRSLVTRLARIGVEHIVSKPYSRDAIAKRVLELWGR